MRGIRAVLAVTAVLLAGCTQLTPGSPMPEPAARAPVTIDTYGLDLSLRDRSDLQTAAVLRIIDPCGFVSPGQLSKYGEVVQVVPYLGPERCRALVHSGSDTGSLMIEVGAYKPDTVTDYPVDGGTVSRRMDTVGGCELIVPARLPVTGVAGPGDTFLDHIGVTAGEFAGDECAPAADVAAKILAAVRDLKLPLRRYATEIVPGGFYDPCAAAGHLPTGWRLTRLATVGQPYDCTFYANGPDGKEQYFGVRLEIDRADASALGAPIDLNGRPGTLYCPGGAAPDMPDNCFADFILEGEVDGNRSGSPLSKVEMAYGRVRTTVSVYGIRAAVETVAAAATALYR
ncbi:hypothetical protein ACFVMC_20895 [Nocardia sp. NPDC127579]|uniref:hypothetical protein n=1 Tax=Nocardia sp. NPDC127579 TaxID=3345402 RepID=UPI0036454034